MLLTTNPLTNHIFLPTNKTNQPNQPNPINPTNPINKTNQPNPINLIRSIPKPNQTTYALDQAPYQCTNCLLLFAIGCRNNARIAEPLPPRFVTAASVLGATSTVNACALLSIGTSSVVVSPPSPSSSSSLSLERCNLLLLLHLFLAPLYNALLWNTINLCYDSIGAVCARRVATRSFSESCVRN
jgi:hypothetical protein